MTESKVPEVSKAETADELKEKGNKCARNEQYAEAVLHYSYAIQLSPADPILYSNRSFVFLKLIQLYYANEDAERAIQLKPDWAKGYFRRAEVQALAWQFDTALLSYGRALQLMPNDISILNAAKRVAALSNRETLYENRMPWAAAGVGIILGSIIVISDQLVAKSPALKHPSIMVLLVIAISCLCFGIAKLYRYFVKLQRNGLLDPPIDIMEGFKKEDIDDVDSDLTPNRTRYSKAQARQRFKKGKT